MLIGQPLPTQEYLSQQKAVQKVRRRSSTSIQSRGGGSICFENSVASLSSLCKFIIWTIRTHLPTLSHALDMYMFSAS
jgi:hypothetical protein